MKTKLCLTTAALALALSSLSAATHYVSLKSTNPTPPYTNWATAATTIQEAVDAAAAGETVLVTNGVYAAGGRIGGPTSEWGAIDGNRVLVTNSITLLSFNGPLVTMIEGGQLTNEVGEVTNQTRCVFLGTGAALSGFSLTNGHASGDGGGVYCEVSALVTNCTLTGNSAAHGGGAHGGTLYDCTLIGNSAWDGGGVSSATLNRCTLSGNSTSVYVWGGGGSGGGAFGCTLSSCTLTANSAFSGGGAYGCTLDNSTLTGNSACWGGGAADCTLNNGTLTSNSAWLGGGAYYGTLNNCSLGGNSADNYGGGAYGGTLNNCTLTGNSAPSGGGASDGTLNNCIVYLNTGANGANYSSGTLNYCCTAPLPGSGTGNISLDPELASASHLSGFSPCRGAGSAAYASGTDIDGEPWLTPPSIGCDEYHPGAVTGPLSVGILATYTNVARGFDVTFTALIEGRATGSVWDFADGTVVSNRPYATYAWVAAGNYAVVLRAYNDSHWGGVSSTVAVQVAAQPVHYVAGDSASPLPPYTSWATAATNIQDAVDVATLPGTLVLVSNGVYATGGRTVPGRDNNRVAVTKPLALHSVNGPQTTAISGGGVRCVYLGDGASLSGFTLTNGSAEYGGGLYCEAATVVVSNCVLVGNSAYSGGGAFGGVLYNCTVASNRAVGRVLEIGVGFSLGGYGGGLNSCIAYGCTIIDNHAVSDLFHMIYGYPGGGGASYCMLANCVLSRNSAHDGGSGGGAFVSTLNNCTLTDNGPSGGGADSSTLNNCIVYFNRGNYSGGTLNYCCTTPMPTDGIGNITNAPLFVDYLCGDLRLQSNSPCINAGNNAYVSWSTDLDGLPRILGGTVDMGAYEFNPNVAPTADASATRPLWISPNGLSANVVLDGSRSSDADGDPLQYHWLSTLNSQPSTILATGVVAVVQFHVGIHSILLVVEDGLASATNAVTVEVITTAQAVQRLMARAQADWRRSQPLIASLSAALRSIERGNAASAINQLQAFQHKVRAQVAPSSPALAAGFLQTAQEIIDALSGGQTNPGGRPHGKLTAARHQASGHVQLQFPGVREAVCILEASTNLVHWEKIGVAVDHGDDTFTFDDPNAAQFPNRFYRVVSP